MYFLTEEQKNIMAEHNNHKICAYVLLSKKYLCRKHLSVSHNRMLRGEDIVDTADGRRMRSGLHHIGIGLCFLSDLAHHGDEAVERLLRLVLRRLDHQ